MKLLRFLCLDLSSAPLFDNFWRNRCDTNDQSGTDRDQFARNFWLKQFRKEGSNKRANVPMCRITSSRMQKRRKVTENVEKWLKMSKNDGKCQKMTENVEKMTANVETLLKMSTF
jgi:hypothetical protein